MQSPGETPKSGKKKALVVTILSTVLWLASIGLSFAIKPGDKFIFVPDTLLLLGFFPLLWLWGRDWVTFLFGLFNSFIGFFLLILDNLPPDKFTGPMQLMRDHLLQMHSCWTWLIIGIFSGLWGAVAMAVSLVLWLCRRTRKEEQGDNSSS